MKLRNVLNHFQCFRAFKLTRFLNPYTSFKCY
jgi:hypothetical protein